MQHTVDTLDSVMSGYQHTKRRVSRSQGFPSEACSADEEESDSRGAVFCTPELPRGQHLQLNILSTWGDRYYVGLTGVEVFTETGEKASITEVKGYVVYMCDVVCVCAVCG